MDEQSRRPLMDLLRRFPPLRDDMSLAAAAPRIADAGGGLPVVDSGGRLVGYLGETDLLGALLPGYLRELRDTDFLTRDLPTLARHVAGAAKAPVGAHMSTTVASVDEDCSEMHAAELFLHNAVRSLPVVGADGTVLGVLRLADLISDLMRIAAREHPDDGG
jgi:CBS domain-containing protein